LEKGEDVVAVGLSFNQVKEPRCRLIVCCSFHLDKDGVLNVEPTRARLLVIALVVNEHQQRIAEAVNLLSGALEGAGRLWLANARHFDVHTKFRKVDALGGITTIVGVAALEMGLKLVLQVCTDGLAICNAKKASLQMLRLCLRESGCFLVQ